MSADLWSAFASSSDDPTSNPWAEKARSETSPAPTPEKVGAFIDLPDAALWSQEQGASVASSGSALQQAASAVWSPKAPNGLNTNKAARSEVEEDDFGDFEAPVNLATPEGNAKVSKLPRTDRKPNRSVKEEPSRTTKALSEPQDPYSNLDQLLHSTSPHARDDPEASRDAPRKSRNPSLALVEELVPYTEDEWGEFSPEPLRQPAYKQRVEVQLPEAEKEQAASQLSKPQSIPGGDAAAASKNRGATQERRPPTGLPPTNVPPPSILMNLLATLIQKLPAQIEEALKTGSHGASIALERAVRQCLASLRVAARITAGRKLRWKRDQHLAQSMSIGPAGRPGGMKLVGVDKGEVQREDREAAELVRIWQQKLGSIRNALAAVNRDVAGRPLTLPNLSTAMAVRILKLADGALYAPKCCFLCGLKREERADTVDTDVWDNFREFWSDSWGHSECVVFWEDHEGSLFGRR